MLNKLAYYSFRNQSWRCWKSAIFIISLLLCEDLVIAQVSLPNQLTALKVQEAPEIDGILNEICWQKVEKISNFTQRELNEGEPATEKTVVAAVYTSSTLYFGIWCYDSEPEKIIAKEMKRDFQHWREDNFEIIIDTYHDKRNGYLFVINPNGAREDVLITNEGKGTNRDWNGVWDVAVHINEQGWFAELQIPFSTLKFHNQETQVWGINFERNIRRKNEQVLWQGWSRDYELEMVSHAGTLTGLEGISGGHLLEFKPYVLGGVQKLAIFKTERVIKMGGDINYLLTSNLKLNVTLYPDFAQIESDRLRINLTRFSLYFPEKREFFLESRGAFDFSEQVFYSRRIGIKDGEEIPIIGGVRITGKESGTEIGALSMQTEKRGLEKSTNYSVLRVKQDIWQQSYIGIIATSKKSIDRSNYVYGMDFNYSSSQLFGDKNIRFGAAWTQSQSGINILNNDNTAYRIYFSLPNDFIEYDLAYDVVQNNFNPEVGFIRRKNYKHFFTELQFNPRPAFLPWIRIMEFKPIDIDYYWSDNTNQLESIGAEFRPLGFGTKSGEWFEYNIIRFFDRIDEPFEIHDDIIIPTGGYWFTRHEIQYNTFSGRKIVVGGETSTGGYYTAHRLQNDFFIRLNVNKHLNMSFDYEWNNLQFEQSEFVTHETGGKIEYAFNPKLNTSLYGQWNNEDKVILFNFRVNWIPQIGSDFYLTINQKIDISDSRFKFNDFAILSKLVWRFVY